MSVVGLNGKSEVIKSFMDEKKVEKERNVIWYITVKEMVWWQEM